MFAHVIMTVVRADVEIESNYALAKYTAWIQRLRSAWLANRKEAGGGKVGATQHSSNNQKQKQSLANKQE